MVFSPELGYDPDEWEECSSDTHFMVFGYFTRMFLSLSIIFLTGFLFWMIEFRKQSDKANNANRANQVIYFSPISHIWFAYANQM